MKDSLKSPALTETGKISAEEKEVISTSSHRNEVYQEPLIYTDASAGLSETTSDNYSNVPENNNLHALSETNSSTSNIWGMHLNKGENSMAATETLAYTSLYLQMSEKMKNSAFIKTRTSLKRIPSQSKTKLKHSLYDSQSSKLGTISNCHKTSAVTSDSTAVPIFCSSAIEEETNSSNCCPVEVVATESHNIDSEVQDRFCLSSDKTIQKHTPNSSSYTISLLSQNFSSSNINRVTKHYDENWVSRCTKMNICATSQPNDEPSRSITIQSDVREHDECTNVRKKKCSLHPGILDNNDSNIFFDKPFVQKRKDINFEAYAIGNSKKLKTGIGNVSDRSDDLKKTTDSMENIEKDANKIGTDNVAIKKDSSKRNYEKPSVVPRQQIIEADMIPSTKVTELPFTEKLHYDELVDMEAKSHNNNTTFSVMKEFKTKEENLLNKVKTGKLNENFVKINLKKKVYSRGKKRMTFQKYKRQEWKKKQVLKGAQEGDEVSVKKLTCFSCGDFGHWANKCPGKAGDLLLPLEQYDEYESTFLTLEEAADLAKGIKSSVNDNVSQVYVNSASSVDHGECTVSTTKGKSEYFNDSDDELFTLVDCTDINNAGSAVHTTVNESLRHNFVGNYEKACLSPAVPPIYQLLDGTVISTPPEIFETLSLFGYESFRKGQEQAIMRILSGQSTLLVLSTGSGKSLCYQLSTYLYRQHHKCITLCVSPLVSLMEDQATGLPPFLNAVCLHTQQTAAARDKALNALRSGNVHILLISPEAVVSGRGGGGVLGSLMKELPPIAFACLDEAHCLSEWSHNFRPSYLQVCKVLREKLQVKTLLGLTATARSETVISISNHLQIPDGNCGVIIGTCIPDNLMLSVSRDNVREVALMQLLTGKRFVTCSSIIIYCTRREECERIAAFIRTQLITAAKTDVTSNLKRNRGVSLDAEAYHAGLSGHRRQQIQKKFMSGNLRIVVATVAFGMGIDKSNVRGIIHFNMPRNLESYVQEIGRAGRDGKVAHCHLFLDSADGKDIQELKRHIFVNSLDRYTVRKLLNEVFVPCACAKVNKLLPSNAEDTVSQELHHEKNVYMNTVNYYVCPGHEIALPIESLIKALDMPEENIQTILCYLELNPKAKMKLGHHVYATCNVACYRGPKQLCIVSRSCPPLAAAIALQRGCGTNFERKNKISFPVVETASRMGWNSQIVKQELKNLEWNTTKIKAGGKVASSGIKVEFCDLAFHLICRGDLTEEEQDEILEELYQRTCKQEKDQLRQLQYAYAALREVSYANISECCDDIEEKRSSLLKHSIKEYFSESNDEGLSSFLLEEQLYISPEAENNIRADIRALISIHSDYVWTGRAVARVLHGISSPNFPSIVWGKVRRFWRSHLETDFNLLISIATKEILQCK